ncbi:MAG: NAD-reducing hydrogenase HoxS subunit beta [candidate division WS2 bacterium]|nr:NAD-reducing hydrogenase HoxS subunit beta [Candidatus Lithacetigena glycinireducens]
MGEKITISPVTRIEGHARVTIYLNDNGQVDKTFVHIDQFRGFEKFSEGRPYFEMPQITPRICGICPISHHLAAAKACDALIGVEPPQPAKLLRELIHMGQCVQSHAMHFFHLAGPDLLLGWDSDPALRNVVGLVLANPELALKAVKLRKYGQEIIAKVAGRRIHPTFAVPGGVNTQLTVEFKDSILSELDTMIAYIQEGISIAKTWMEANMEVIEKFGKFPSGYLGLVNEGDSLELYDGTLKLTDSEGKVWERFKPANYLDYIEERVEDWSYLKFPYYKKLSYPEGVYRVGPLARVNNAEKITTPLANEELKTYKSLGNGKPLEGSLVYHYARLIELLYSAERAGQILNDPDVLSNDIIAIPGELQPEGIGVIEAPRGTLIHHYWIDEDGVMQKANLIVSTGHNNWAISKAVDDVAKNFLDGKKLKEGMLNMVEGAIRCYDPCFSCSTHAIGKMPLLVELKSAEGILLDSVKREG